MPQMIKALSRVFGRGHDVQAVVIGEEHKGETASEMARALGILDRLTILALRDDITELVSGMDVFFLSFALGKAFPLAVTEAMASGVPCVATYVGDYTGLVGDTWLVIPQNDPGPQALPVCELLDLGGKGLLPLGDRARKRVKDEFQLPAM